MSEIEIDMRPMITISFECPELIHTDHFIKLHKKIIASKLYKGNYTIKFENLTIDGNFKALINQIDPSGVLFNEFEAKNTCAQ
tara:strand:+ start:120 stop:368 length:249 start_codon:yes stop_codon:yes gene_type:complete